MTDLRARFQSLDRLPAPDLWSEVELRASAAPVRRIPSSSGVLAAAAVLGAILVSGAVLIGTGVLPMPRLVDPGPPPPSASDARSPSPSSSPTRSPSVGSPWTATGPMIDERTEGHSVTLLADGRVLVAGNGRRDARSAELFDPATGSWTAAADMLSGRYDHAATLLADGRVLVTGGREGVVEEEGLASAELYDPSTDAWTITGSMRQPRWGHSAALLADGRVLVVGGYESVSDGDGGGSSRSLSSAELFDPETGSWSAAASPVSWTMGDHTAVRLLDDTVLVAGQRGAEIYLPEDDRWVPTAEMVGSGDSREAVVLLDGRVLVTGSQFYLQIGQSELYDPDTGNWTPTGDMNEPRSWFTATRLPDGRVLAAGGGDGGYGGYATAELYDPVSGTWSPTHDMLAPRGWHEAIALADGRVLVVGGFGGLGSGPDAEIFDPSVGP